MKGRKILEEIYKEYSSLIYNYLKSLCNDDSIAEELTQETFYKAIKNINKFNNECKLNTWLCKIAKNTWIDFLRKEKKFKYFSIDDENFIETAILDKSFRDNLDDREEIINLYKNIHKLDADTREVFYLRLKGELTFKEISIILNKSEEWTRLAFYRGKIKLREAMKNEES